MTKKTENIESPENALHAFDALWIRNNTAFLARYWFTATEALKKVASDSDGITEFEDSPLGDEYVAASIDNHLDHHNHGGILLTYAAFEEFMVTLTRKLGEARDAAIMPNELRDRGVRRYKKYIHKVCRIPLENSSIDWVLLEDMSVVRNAIVHANGNKSLVGNRKELEAVVARRAPKLSFKHGSRLVVSEDFVSDCIMAVRTAGLAINRLAHPKVEFP